jgi:hypothetical protein
MGRQLVGEATNRVSVCPYIIFFCVFVVIQDLAVKPELDGLCSSYNLFCVLCCHILNGCMTSYIIFDHHCDLIYTTGALLSCSYLAKAHYMSVDDGGLGGVIVCVT